MLEKEKQEEQDNLQENINKAMRSLEQSEHEYNMLKEQLILDIEQERENMTKQKSTMKKVERELTTHNQKLFKLSMTAGTTNESSEVFKGAVDEVNKYFR